MDINANQKRDYDKFFIERGDVGFNPKRNEEAIAKSIEKAEKIKREKRKKHYENIGERTEAVSSYLIHLGKGNSTPIDKYFSRKMLAYLQGKKIIQTLVPQKDGSSIIKLDSID